jgi:hypothetical protein
MRPLAAVTAFLVLSAGECQPGDLGVEFDLPGTVVVTNVGRETAVVAITADDARSHPTLPGGGSASVSTNVGGRYEVRVLMTPENARRYHADLLALRKTVTDLVATAPTAAEKTRFFVALAGIKSQLLTMGAGGAAGCTGTIELGPDANAQVNATVAWVSEGDGGFWDATCGSGQSAVGGEGADVS